MRTKKEIEDIIVAGIKGAENGEVIINLQLAASIEILIDIRDILLILSEK